MSDDLGMEIVTGLDQPIPIAGDSLETLYYQIDCEINNAFDTKNPDIAMNAASMLLTAGRLSGWGLCRLLWKLDQHWEIFGLNVEMSDYCQKRIGLSKETITRYIRNWDQIEESPQLPADVKEQIRQRPMKDVNAIATVLASYEVEPEQLQKLVDAPDNTSVLAVCREIKGAEPRRNTCTIRMKRDGTVYVYDASGAAHYVGELAVDRRDNPHVDKAITRIINSSGILCE